MSTSVHVNTRSHSVTYVTDMLLRTLMDVIRESGLSPERLAAQWDTLDRGITTWLRSKHLESVLLEVFDPRTGGLVGRWDFEIMYGSFGEGGFWIDPNEIKYHIVKQGIWPSQCSYGVLVTTGAGCEAVPGWSSCSLRSTRGFVRQSIGTAICGNGHLRSTASYWRKA